MEFDVTVVPPYFAMTDIDVRKCDEDDFKS